MMQYMDLQNLSLKLIVVKIIQLFLSQKLKVIMILSKRERRLLSSIAKYDNTIVPTLCNNHLS